MAAAGGAGAADGDSVGLLEQTVGPNGFVSSGHGCLRGLMPLRAELGGIAFHFLTRCGLRVGE